MVVTDGLSTDCAQSEFARFRQKREDEAAANMAAAAQEAVV